MGGEIQTCNLDTLAKYGTIFGDLYAAPTCSPARAMLLTDTASQQADLDTVPERMQPRHADIAGYGGYLNRRGVRWPAY